MKNSWVICFLIFSNFVFSQKINEKKTNKQLENFAYIDVIETYEKWIAKGKSNTEILEKLGDAYYFKGDLKKANVYYQKAYHPKIKMDKNRLFRYYQTLKATQQLTKADEVLKKFQTLYPDDRRGKLNSMGMHVNDDFDLYQLDSLSFNSPFSDYGSFVWNEKLYFTSARDTAGFKRRKHAWTGERFTNLYEFPLSGSDSLAKAIKTKLISQSRFNESSMIINQRGDMILFTRNNLSGRKKIKGKEGSVNLGIYQIHQKDGKWSEPVSVSFNHPDFQVAHPTWDSEERFLYFAANFTDTKGLSDLYRVAIDANGNFEKPQNLGNSINTEGRETFPFVLGNQLYFASDGHAGMGGLDIFVADILPDGTFSKPINLGKKINSPSDDFAFFMQNDSLGFLSSNRSGGKGNDDLYRIHKKKPKPCRITLKLKIKNILSENELAVSENAILFQKDSVWQIFPFGNGLEVDCSSSLNIKINEEGFEPFETTLHLANEDLTEELMLQPIPESCKTGDDLAIKLQIKQIFFDLDRWNIREDAALELTKILAVLMEFPQMKIDIRSHTDARAKAQYNLELSEKRAQSTLKWFIDQGIEPERLSAKGYGELQLVNECADDVPCSEEAHQQNRRSEFIVVE
jgi:outer membrane protein OmpA-like peptidoglycan-associated protein